MSKGVLTEALVFVIVSISALALSAFFFSEATLRGAEVERTIARREMDETTMAAVSTLFNGRLEMVEKTYMGVMIDAAQEENRTQVYYGDGLGRIITTEVIDPLMDDYFGNGRWELIVEVENNEVIYGKLESDIEHQYKFKIPDPMEDQGLLILNVG